MRPLTSHAEMQAGRVNPDKSWDFLSLENRKTAHANELNSDQYYLSFEQIEGK
jgi:hypothetical protein